MGSNHEKKGQKSRETLPLKGVGHKIFDLQFFSLFEPIWAPDKQAKIFSNWVSISRRYSNFLKALQCASHRGVRLRGVHHSAESDSAVCITPRSQALRCASLRGVKGTNFLKNSAVCILPRSQAPRCASHRGVKLHTAESKSKSLEVSGCF